MREGLAHESKRLDIRERKGEKQWRGTGKEILQLVATATRKQLISVCDVCECVWACRSISVADKWPDTTCGERSILTIISSSFLFISSDLSVALVLHHNKLQHTNPLMAKPPDHDTHKHTDIHWWTHHILFLIGKLGLEMNWMNWITWGHFGKILLR